jgi:hypothetical protein
VARRIGEAPGAAIGGAIGAGAGATVAAEGAADDPREAAEIRDSYDLTTPPNDQNSVTQTFSAQHPTTNSFSAIRPP